MWCGLNGVLGASVWSLEAKRVGSTSKKLGIDL